jgi:hypothetical protein
LFVCAPIFAATIARRLTYKQYEGASRAAFFKILRELIVENLQNGGSNVIFLAGCEE